MVKKRTFPIAVHLVGAVSGRRGPGRDPRSDCRVRLHGAYTVTFIRGPRDVSPWREEGRRRQLAQVRAGWRGRWDDQPVDGRPDPFGIRNPWKRERPPATPPLDSDQDRGPSVEERILITGGKNID